MSVLDVEKIKKMNNERETFIQWCEQAIKDFYKDAKEIELEPYSYLCSSSNSDLTKPYNATKKIWNLEYGLFPHKYAEFYVIMLSDRFDDNSYLNLQFSAAITYKTGRLYYDGKRASIRHVAEIVAEACGYVQGVAKRLFESALQREPWSYYYAQEQVEKYKNPSVYIDGDNNTVGGGDVYKF